MKNECLICKFNKCITDPSMGIISETMLGISTIDNKIHMSFIAVEQICDKNWYFIKTYIGKELVHKSNLIKFCPNCGRNFYPKEVKRKNNKNK